MDRPSDEGHGWYENTFSFFACLTPLPQAYPPPDTSFEESPLTCSPLPSATSSHRGTSQCRSPQDNWGSCPNTGGSRTISDVSSCRPLPLTQGNLKLLRQELKQQLK